VELNSFSKTFSFAGYRIGYAVGNPEVIAAMAKVKSQLDSGIFKPIQEMAAFALQNMDENWQQQMLLSYQQRRDRISELLTKLGMSYDLPQGALYIWARIPDAYEDSESFCEELLEKRQILFVPGTAFGQNGKRYVRVSICVNLDDIDQY
jgi:aspartate/methionine/tyrosine aminotransferase